MSRTAIALDIGRSAMKMAYRDPNTGAVRHEMIPSLAMPAIRISDEVERLRALKDTVEVDGRNYFVGQTALVQGGERENALSDDWISSPEHTALILAGLKRAGATADSVVVLGLPARLYGPQCGALREIAQKATGLEVKVVPQPMGPFQRHMLDESGMPVSGRSLRDSWASIDVGRFTTDIILMVDGRWKEKAADSCRGVAVAVESLRGAMSARGIDLDYSEAEDALRSGKVRNFNQEVGVVAEATNALKDLEHEVIETAQRLIGAQARKLNGVLLAGGGAQFIATNLRAMWPHAELVKDARYAVAEGMRRMVEGILAAQRRMQTNNTAA